MHENSTLNENIEIENWFQKLEQEEIIAKINRNDQLLFHINTQAKFIYSKTVVDKIKSGFHSEEEKGGYIIFEYTIIDGIVILKALDVEWIENLSDNRLNSYKINTVEHKRIERQTYLKQLFPLRFHTHPMDAKDVFSQHKRRLEIIDTSDPDKDISFNFPFCTENIKLLMPDILVVWDINYLDSFFIGIYNGLIAPIGFLNHRVKVTKEFNSNIGKSIFEWAEDSDLKKMVLALGTVITIVGVVSYPNVAMPLYRDLKNQNPILAIGTQKENHYFGFANPNSIFEFVISIPKVTTALLCENENEIKTVVARLNEKRKVKVNNSPLT
jgi:hypothetical protein